MQHLVRKPHPHRIAAVPAAADISWKIIAAAIGLAVAAYLVVLLRLMTFTLLAMHGDISDMRNQLHQTTSALGQTNQKLLVVNRHLVATNQELLQTNGKLLLTNGRLRIAGAGVLAMKADTGRMISELSAMQRGLSFMLGDIHQMTHRIVRAKLLF